MFHIWFLPFHISYGVLACTALVGFQFRTYKTDDKVSAQNFLSSFESDNIARTVSTNTDLIFQLLHFALVFWEQCVHGVYLHS